MKGGRPVGANAQSEASRLGLSFHPAGHDGSIAAVRLAPAEWRAIPEPARRQWIASLKAADFRYVALDITAAIDEG
jgi:hypothetical protein